MTGVDPFDVARCPRGQRCESCGREGADLAVHTIRLDVLGLACMTMCSDCAGSTVLPPVTVGTAARLVAQHAEHLGVDLDKITAALAEE